MNFNRFSAFDACGCLFKQCRLFVLGMWCILFYSSFFMTGAYANSSGTQPVTQATTPQATTPQAITNPIGQPHHINMSDEVKQVFNQIEEKKLAYHPTWLRLLHYQNTKIEVTAEVSSNENNASRVENASFFVSSRGATDPQAEIVAMISELLSADDARKGNSSVQCRFPARTHWLTQQLGLTPPQKANCEQLAAWQNKLNPQQLAVVFAQEYPDSMTSAFAHTLLRVDAFTSSQTETSKTDDYQTLHQTWHKTSYQTSHAINYTVAGDDADSMPVYAIKSMTGKYAGMMTIDPYLPKIANYLQKEHRDVWTYPLALNKAEVEQIIRHVWEVKDLSIPYYFLTDNCASEILRLVDVVRPSNQLYDEVSTAAIPSEVIRLLDEQQLLKQGEFVPAVNSEKQAQQNKQNRVNHASPLNSMLLPKIATQSDSHFNASINAHINAPKTDPTSGNNLQRASIALGQQGSHNYAEVGVRASYHDLLDSGLGYRQNLHLEGLSAKLRFYENSGEADKVQLQEATLLRGRSYHPINTARAGSTWGINAQLTQVNDASVNYENSADNQTLTQQHLVGSIGYEKGVSYAFGTPSYETDLPPHLCYALGNGQAQLGKGLTNGFRVGAGANLGCAFKASQKLRAVTQLSVPYWYHSETGLNNRKQGYWQPTVNVGMQYDIAKNHAIRLTADYELSKRVANDIDAQLGYYFYF